MKIHSSILAFLLLMITIDAEAVTYYVSKQGSDGVTCANATCSTAPSACTSSNSKLTIASGLPCLSPGDTLYIRSGTYAERIYSQGQTVPNGTDWNNPVTMSGYTGETVTITGASDGVITFGAGAPVTYFVINNVVLDASGKANGFATGNDSNNIRISNSEIKNAREQNIISGCYFFEVLNTKIHDAGYFGGNTPCTEQAFADCYGLYVTGHDNLFEGNEIYDNGGYGLHLFNTGHTDVSDNIIRNNIFHGNGFFPDARGGTEWSAFILSSGSNNQAYNNIVYGNIKGMLVAFATGSTNNQVYNNTVYNNTTLGIEVQGSASGTVIRNNIYYNNATNMVDDGVSTTLSNNLCNATLSGLCTGGNPAFVNAAGNDFHLQSGSDALDAGFNLSGVFTTDFDGVTRPQGLAYDIGAYEFVVSGSSVPTIVRIIR
jgi:parallel beta-helix repeat protein